MKKVATFLLPIIILLLACSSVLLAHSPHDNVPTVAISPGYGTDSTVFCCLSHNNQYILKSTNEGETWSPSQIGFPNHTPTYMALSPDFETDGTAFVATKSGTVFRSTDGCVTWENSSVGLPETKIRSVAFSPDFANDQIVFVGTENQGIYRTFNGGDIWYETSTGLTNKTVYSIAISPDFATDRTIFLGTASGLKKSTNRGGSWFDPFYGSAGVPVISVALSGNYAQDQTVFVGTWGYGVFKSENGGVSWLSRNDGLTELYVTSVGLSPDYANDELLLVATRQAGIFQSVNGGANYFIMNSGLDTQTNQTSIHYFKFSFSPDFAYDRTVYLATWEGLHKSRSDMTGWRHLDVFSQNLSRGMTISPDFKNDGTLFVGAYGGGIYRTTDRGDTWKATHTGLSSIHTSAMTISPNYKNDNTVMAADSAGVDKSALSGNSWFCLPVNSSDFIYIRSLAISPDYAVDKTFFAGNGSSGTYPLYKTIDGGANFTPIDPGFPMARCLAISPDYASDQTIFAGVLFGVCRSTDGGFGWELVGINGQIVHSVALSPGFASDGIVFAGVSEAGVYKSTDFGNTWTAVGNGLGDATVNTLVLSPNFTSDGILYAGTKSQGLFKSTDGGISWSYLALQGTFLLSSAISPDFASDGTLFLGTWEGVMRSTDWGATWERVQNVHRRDDESEFVTFTGNWGRYHDSFTSASTVSVTGNAFARAKFTFYGDSVSWIGAQSSFAGWACIYIDGDFQKYIDLYSPTMEYQKVLFTATGLDYGPHTITIQATGTKNSSSTGTSIFVDAFEYGY